MKEMNMIKHTFTLLTALLLAPLAALAAHAPAKAEKPKAPAPFVYDGNPERLKYELAIKPDENVAYGPHRMQVIYFWRAKSDPPTPLLVYIHGGGWSGGDRSVVRSMLKPDLDAGACTSLWLAFHDDLADPRGVDPVARESTRVLCAAVSGAQTTLDPHQMREWTPNSKYGAHAFGIAWDATLPVEGCTLHDGKCKAAPGPCHITGKISNRSVPWKFASPE